MTQQSEIINDPKYIAVLDHGFCGLTDHLGDDSSIVRAARVSYGAGTKKVSEDRGLIRYLLRHAHTSPIEMIEFCFHLKMPIFVARQLIRTRTASLNEYSGRYSVMSDEFYIPEPEQIKPQSADNKQGRAGEIDANSKTGVQWLMRTAYEHAYAAYKVLLGERDGAEEHYDAYSDEQPLLSTEFPGLARELARSVLPVANYTEMRWKIDLNNLFKFIKLREDHHAQYEIRVLANAMHTLIQPIVPLACEAFRDYMQEAATLSRMEIDLVIDLLDRDKMRAAIETHGGVMNFATHYGLSKRELTEFASRFAIDI